MDCPFCGKPMIPGRMTAGGYQIRWVPEGVSTALSAFDSRRIVISPLSMSTKGKPAEICPDCRKVITDF